MEPIVSVSFPGPSGRLDSLTIEHDGKEYALSRHEGATPTSVRVFTTKRDLRAFLKSAPNNSDTQECSASMLLYARFVNATEHPIFDLRDLNTEYPFGLILVGGVAIYLQTKNVFRAQSAELTRHVACYVSREQFDWIRDRDVVIPKPPVHRSEFRRESLRVTLHVEREHRLAIPYEDIDRHASIIDGICVAAKEHLLVLRTDEAINFFDLTEGREAREDLVALLIGMDNPKGELLVSSLDDTRLSFLRELANDTTTFGEMLGYAPHASDYQRWLNNRLDEIENATRYAEGKNRRKAVQARRQHVFYQYPRVINRDVAAMRPNLNLLPVRVAKTNFDGPLTTIRTLCAMAGIRYEHPINDPPFVGIAQGTGNLRALDKHDCKVYVVDCDQFMAESPHEEALRILEVLAHSFHDFTSRKCVNGLFR